MNNSHDGSGFCQRVLLVIVLGMAGALFGPILLPLFFPMEKVAQREATSLLHKLYPQETIREVQCVRNHIADYKFDCVALKGAPPEIPQEIRVRCSIKSSSRRECTLSGTSS